MEGDIALVGNSREPQFRMAMICLLEKGAPFRVNHQEGGPQHPLSQWFWWVRPNFTGPVLLSGTAKVRGLAEIAKFLDQQFGGPRLWPSHTDYNNLRYLEMLEVIRLSVQRRYVKEAVGSSLLWDIPKETVRPDVTDEQTERLYISPLRKEFNQLAEKDTRLSEHQEFMRSFSGVYLKLLDGFLKRRRASNANPSTPFFLHGGHFGLADAILATILRASIEAGWAESVWASNTLAPTLLAYYNHCWERPSVFVPLHPHMFSVSKIHRAKEKPSNPVSGVYKKKSAAPSIENFLRCSKFPGDPNETEAVNLKRSFSFGDLREDYVMQTSSDETCGQLKGRRRTYNWRKRKSASNLSKSTSVTCLGSPPIKEDLNRVDFTQFYWAFEPN